MDKEDAKKFSKEAAYQLKDMWENWDSASGLAKALTGVEYEDLQKLIEYFFAPKA